MTEQELKSLVQELSLEEKAYQLTQAPGFFYMEDAQISGTDVENTFTEEELALMGSCLYVFGPEEQKRIQKQSMDRHPHHIPMVFMMDVIHGFRTVFPTPLGMGATFDPALAGEMMRTAAAECSSFGVQVAFSPMLDLVRDARWGRVMESTGEDPFLNGVMGRAMVHGLQGDDESSCQACGQANGPESSQPGGRGRIPAGSVSSCIKHYAAYGAPEGGRDYQNVELSEHTLREYYLPAYRKAVEAGADLVMTSFPTIGGVPAAGNPWLVKDILRGEWGFEGVVITDWAAISELVEHRICADLKEAALLAFKSGVDMDMCSMAYNRYLPELVREGKISEEELDASVLRVLRLKNRLGLFENPYKDADAAMAEKLLLCDAHREAARKAVRESLVLLKNEGEQKVLPLQKGEKTALIGPYVDCKELHSSWAPNGQAEDAVSVREAADEHLEIDFIYAAGCRLDTREELLERSREASIAQLRQGTFAERQEDEKAAALREEAVERAKEADRVVLFLGEHRSLSGEAASRTELTLPENQMELLRAVTDANPNAAAVIFSGRPLDLREICRRCRSIVFAWLPGTEGGHGIMDVLTGQQDFSGKLPMSIPVTVGQVPVFYNHLSTGRPKILKLEDLKQEDANFDETKLDDPTFRSAYIDTPNAPLFPFGYGLHYGKYDISPVTLSQTEVCGTWQPTDESTVISKASVEAANCGDYDGTVALQLYIRDDVSSLARPVRELKGFERVNLAAGEKKTVTFDITPAMLSFIGADQKPVLEKGSFTIWIGEDSETENEAVLEVK